MKNQISKDYAALALVVLKSKPPRIDVEDYILALRDSLIDEACVAQGSDGIIDTTRLWHKLFIHAQRQNLESQAELSAHRAGSDPEDDQYQPVQVVPRKRKRAAKANTQSKRQRLDQLALHDTEEPSILAPQQHRDRSLLLRIIFGLARHPDGVPPTDDGITHLICLACESITETFERANDCSAINRANATEPLVLNEVCIASRKVWSLMASRLCTATHVDTAMVASQAGPVITMFIHRLRKYCLDEAVAAKESLKRWNSMKKANTKKVRAKDTERQELFRHNCDVLALAIAHIMAEATRLQADHVEIFEAISSIFLGHLGSAVSLLLFEDTSDNKEGGLLPPSTLKQALHVNILDAIHGVKLEAPFLITILKSLVYTKEPQTAESQSWQLYQDNVVLEMLQRSLLRGMFGTESETDSAKTAQSQNVHPPKEGMSEAATRQEENDGNWLLSQVWDFLGWDVLFKDDTSNPKSLERPTMIDPLKTTW